LLRAMNALDWLESFFRLVGHVIPHSVTEIVLIASVFVVLFTKFNQVLLRVFH
jgi:hypothetical protein